MKIFFSQFGVRHSITYISLIIVSIIFINCNKEDNCLEFVQEKVSKVEGDTVGQLNQGMTFYVTFSCNNGCGHFGFFDENISDNLISVAVVAKYEGCICWDYLPKYTVEYTFTPDKPGTYYLSFHSYNDTFITHTLKVY